MAFAFTCVRFAAWRHILLHASIPIRSLHLIASTLRESEIQHINQDKLHFKAFYTQASLQQERSKDCHKADLHGGPVSLASSVSLGDSTETFLRRSALMGSSTPPQSITTVTPLCDAICKTKYVPIKEAQNILISYWE